MFQTHKEDPYERMWAFMTINEEKAILGNTSDIVQRVKDGSYVFIADGVKNEYYATRHCGKTCYFFYECSLMPLIETLQASPAILLVRFALASLSSFALIFSVASRLLKASLVHILRFTVTKKILKEISVSHSTQNCLKHLKMEKAQMVKHRLIFPLSLLNFFGYYFP